MGTDGYQTYHGDHFVMHRNIESLFCAPGANTVLQVNYTSTNKHTNSQKKRSDLWLPEAGSENVGNWMKVVKKVQTSSYKINTKDVMYNIIKIINTAVYYI